jgi:hypothetical protein
MRYYPSSSNSWMMKYIFQKNLLLNLFSIIDEEKSNYTLTLGKKQKTKKKEEILFFIHVKSIGIITS